MKMKDQYLKKRILEQIWDKGIKRHYNNIRLQLSLSFFGYMYGCCIQYLGWLDCASFC